MQIILVVDAVVSCQRECFNNNVVGICRVGQDLLESYHAGVEHQFTDCILTAAQTVTFINRTVLQHKPCLLRIVKNIHMLTSMFLLLVSILKLTV